MTLVLSPDDVQRVLRDEFRLQPPDRLDAGHPLPGTLGPFALRFEVE